MKKLLLFLALSVGSAGAMQSDIMQWDAAGTIPVEQQAQVNQAVATVAEQASVLNPEQRQQVVDQAAKNVQKLVDSCGGDKELLKTTLTQRIKNLLKHPVAGPVVMTLFTCAEVAVLLLAIHELIQGINFVAAITLGKQMLIPNWFSLQKFDHWGPVLCLRIGVILGWYVGL